MIITIGKGRLLKEFSNFTRKHYSMRNLRILFVFFFVFGVTAIAKASPADSIGSEVIDGKVYILYQVEEGETVYSISQKYNVRMRDIVAVSPEVKKGLTIGMVIHVPYRGVKVSESKERYHVVEAGETLYGISRMYNVSVDQLMKWNELESSALAIGQQLTIAGGSVNTKPEKEVNEKGNLIHIVEQGEGLYGIARIYNVTVDDLIKWNQLQSTSLSIGQKLIVGLNAKGNYVHPSRIDTTQESLGRRYEVEKVLESGLAATIDGSDNTNKYLALHRTAKVGTIIAVRNEMNDQMVFVRVVGKLPNTGVNNKVIIRISDAAYKKLGAIDPKFRVQLSYLPDR